MSFYHRYSLLIGLLALVLVVVLLLSTPGSAFSSGVTFIDTELHRATGDEAYVRTRMDLGSSEAVRAFPCEFGGWSGYDYETSSVEESLGAEAVLLRGYTRAGLYQPLFFLIMQARTESSFHPPPVCYAGLGYRIEEQGPEEVSVASPVWAGKQSCLSLPLKKIVVSRENAGSTIERRLALYFYVKDNQLVSDAVTMIRVEALAPLEGSYDGILEVSKSFLADAVPHLFEPASDGEWKPLAVRLADGGLWGYFLILLLLTIPLAIAVCPRTKLGPGVAKWRGSKS